MMPQLFLRYLFISCLKLLFKYILLMFMDSSDRNIRAIWEEDITLGIVVVSTGV